jgi:RNA polymerase sigma-70 factor (ECF subfamily)
MWRPVTNPIPIRARSNEVSGPVSADRTLVTKIAHGDDSALAQLYDTYGAAVYSLALRILKTPGEAEEVVQEVFAQVWRQAPRYDSGRATVAGWLMMLTRTRALDALRARTARPDVDRPVDVPELPSAPNQEALIITEEKVARVRHALGALDEPLRVPLELAYYDGLTQSEIAARLQQPIGTVKTRMRAALTRLREALSGEETR